MLIMRPWNKPSNETIWNPKKKRENYDRYAYDEVYNTRRWQRLRLLHLHKQPLCQQCERIGKSELGYVVDHIKAIKDGGNAWDEDNLQTLCKRCHAVKTNIEINERKKNK